MSQVNILLPPYAEQQQDLALYPDKNAQEWPFPTLQRKKKLLIFKN